MSNDRSTVPSLARSSAEKVREIIQKQAAHERESDPSGEMMDRSVKRQPSTDEVSRMKRAVSNMHPSIYRAIPKAMVERLIAEPLLTADSLITRRRDAVIMTFLLKTRSYKKDIRIGLHKKSNKERYFRSLLHLILSCMDNDASGNGSYAVENETRHKTVRFASTHKRSCEELYSDLGSAKENSPELSFDDAPRPVLSLPAVPRSETLLSELAEPKQLTRRSFDDFLGYHQRKRHKHGNLSVSYDTLKGSDTQNRINTTLHKDSYKENIPRRNDELLNCNRRLPPPVWSDDDDDSDSIIADALEYNLTQGTRPESPDLSIGENFSNLCEEPRLVRQRPLVVPPDIPPKPCDWIPVDRGVIKKDSPYYMYHMAELEKCTRFATDARYYSYADMDLPSPPCSPPDSPTNRQGLTNINMTRVSSTSLNSEEYCADRCCVNRLNVDLPYSHVVEKSSSESIVVTSASDDHHGNGQKMDTNKADVATKAVHGVISAPSILVEESNAEFPILTDAPLSRPVVLSDREGTQKREAGGIQSRDMDDPNRISSKISVSSWLSETNSALYSPASEEDPAPT